MIEQKFNTLCNKFTNNRKIINILYQEILNYYSSENRYYHNLNHLTNIYSELPILNDSIEFAIFYHDIIYDIKKKDNEYQSALLCKKRLLDLNVDEEVIKEATKLVIETKNHNPSSLNNALFLDADLSILGKDYKTYQHYTKMIRLEYSLFSDYEYYEGRKKVLEKFLKKDRIYKSNYFYRKYELQARKNILKELYQIKSF